MCECVSVCTIGYLAAAGGPHGFSKESLADGALHVVRHGAHVDAGAELRLTARPILKNDQQHEIMLQ